MLLRKVILMLLLGFTCSMTFSGEAVSGRYIYGGGVGAVECPKFVEIMQTAKTHKLDSLGYVYETQGFLMYIAGFQTAYNLQTPNTCDIFDGLSDNQLLAWAETYCQTHPLKKFNSAVVALAQEVYPNRSQKCK